MSRGHFADRRKEEGRRVVVTGKLPDDVQLAGTPYVQQALWPAPPEPGEFHLVDGKWVKAPVGITGPESTKPLAETVMPSGARVLIDCADVTLLRVPNSSSADDTPLPDFVTKYLLGVDLSQFEQIPGMYRKYRRHLKWGAVELGWEGIRGGMGVHLHIQGEACRQLESWEGFPGWEVFFARAIELGHVVRLDLAVDDRPEEGQKPLLDLDVIMSCKRKVRGYRVSDGQGGDRVPTRIRSRFEQFKLIEQGFTSSGDGSGKGLYLGEGKVLVRFYDKGLQKGLSQHWVRCELQLRDERADQAARYMLQRGVGPTACGALAYYVAFVKPVRDENYNRWPVYGWWTRFLSEVERLPLSKAPVTVDLDESLRWVESSAGPTFALALEAMGGDVQLLWQWFVGMVVRAHERLKPRHWAKLKAWRAVRPDWAPENLYDAGVLPHLVSPTPEPLPEPGPRGQGLLSVLGLTDTAWGVTPSPVPG